MPTDENQKRIFEFLVEHFKSQVPFTKEDMDAVTDWKGTTFSTYWSKQMKSFVVPAGADTYRVSEAFRPYLSWDRFQQHVTQVRQVSSDYTALMHDMVLIYEFFMPLTNEDHLRRALDALFYKDTVQAKLSALDKAQVRAQFPVEAEETDAQHFERLCDWIARKFSGYSITHVSGRFRAASLLTLQDASALQADGGRYLVDETTAVVRFIFPCGGPVVKQPAFTAEGFSSLDVVGRSADGRAEARRVRWFFNRLFVQSIVQVVNGQDEIWMIEMGMRTRLHIWRIER